MIIEMYDPHQQQHEAATLAAKGAQLYREGALEQAATALREATLRYAEAHRIATAEGEETLLWLDVRAQTCQLYGDCLAELNELAEAVNTYQEATDVYGQLAGLDAQQEARICARKALTCIAALQSRPYDRLYLLIAHYERQQRQLQLQVGTKVQQAECVARIARIFMRRDRHEEAVARYREALQLYKEADPQPAVLLACAECHHRLADLLAYNLNDLIGSAHHYRKAITLFGKYKFGEMEAPGPDRNDCNNYQEARTICIQGLAEVERRLHALSQSLDEQSLDEQSLDEQSLDEIENDIDL